MTLSKPSPTTRIASNTSRRLSRAVALALVWSCAASAATTVYVSPDNSTGATEPAADKANTVHSLQDALLRVRTLKSTKATGPFVIRILPGRYFLAQPVVLGPEDSGAQGAPLVIEGAERDAVILTGAKPLTVRRALESDPILSRIPGPIRASILSYHLADNSIPGWADSPDVAHAANAAKSYPLHLFINGAPATLARWPTTGFATIQNHSDSTPDKFSPAPELPGSWQFPVKVLAFGYWGNNWSSERLPATVLNATTVALNDAKPQYGIRTSQRFFLENIPEALVNAGQWYLDQSLGNVYIASATKASFEVAVTDTLLSIKGASDVTFRDLTFEDSRANLVSADSVKRLLFEDCRLRNAGGTAATIAAAVSSGVRRCVIENSGGAGIRLSGGDRHSLSAAANFVDDCTIRAFGRIVPTYQPGVQLDGVGSRVDHNEIYGGPHTAILFSGNDHLISHNNIHNVAQQTSDVGAIYTGRDWTARGTIIENNYLHDIRGYNPPWATGVYLDDQASGITVRQNLFVRTYRSVLIGGGLDNTIVGNVFVSSTPAVFMDQRGLNWQKAVTADANGPLQKNLRAVSTDAALYYKRYPALAGLTADGIGIPRRNTISGNLAVDGPLKDFHLDKAVLAYQKIGVNWQTIDFHSVWAQPIDPAHEINASAFTIRPDSPWIKSGFEPFSLNDFGPRLSQTSRTTH